MSKSSLYKIELPCKFLTLFPLTFTNPNPSAPITAPGCKIEPLPIFENSLIVTFE